MCKLINVIHHINKHMNKNHMIMSINMVEKTLESLGLQGDQTS